MSSTLDFATTSSFRPQLYLGFVGKRTLGNPAAVRVAIASRLDALARALPGVEIVAIGSAAVGTDQLVLELVRERHWAWRIMLPFAEGIFEEDFKDDISLRRTFQMLCSEAAAVSIIPAARSRRDGFTLCAEAVARQSDVMLLAWDQQPGRQGGTAESLHLARQVGKLCIVIHSDTGAILVDDTTSPERLATLRLAVSKRHEQGILARLGEIGAQPSATVSHLADAKCPTEFLFDRLRQSAYALGKTHRNANVFVLLVHGVASLFGVLGLVFEAQLSHSAHLAFSAFEFLFVAAGVTLTMWIRRNHLHARWVETRYLTEIVRSLVSTARCPVRDDYVSRTTWEVYASLRLPLTTFFGRFRNREVLPPREFAEKYLVERIRHQLEHHRDKYDQARFFHSVIQGAFLGCTLLILSGAAGAFIFSALGKTVPLAWQWQLLVRFAPVYLPLVSAALLVLPNLNDLNRRCTTYGAVVEKLSRLADETRRLIDESVAPPPTFLGVPIWQNFALSENYFRNRLHALVHETERVLLTEVVEFQSFCKHAEVG